MLEHYLKTALRSLYRNKLYAAVNILGLAVGIAATLLLAKYVGFNLTYDNFHQKKDLICLVKQKETKNGWQSPQQNNTYFGVGQMAVDMYPEVSLVTRVIPQVETLVMATTKEGQRVSFNENRISAVDTSFFSIFSFVAIAGSTETALSAPDAIVLTESTARKYFGDSDPIGQLITTRVSWGEQTTYKVTCVVADPPLNSSLQFDLLVSAGMGAPTAIYWNDPSYATYLLLGAAADANALSMKMSKDIGEHTIVKSEGKKIDFSLQRISDFTLTPNDRMLVMVGLFILIISWINFINLSTGRAQNRSKETGVRKVVGATRKQVITQFVFECLIINAMALLLATLIFVVVKPLVLEFSNNKVLPLFQDPTPVNWVFASVFIAGALASSAYPALIMSGLNPVNSLKGKFVHGKHSLTFRKALVVGQFTISVIAAIGVFVISDQLKFLQQQDLKLDIDRIITLKAPKDLWDGKTERMNAFKDEAMQLPMVEGVSSCTTIPGQAYRHEINFALTTSKDRHLFYLNDVDANFFPLYGIRFLAGANYNIEMPYKNRKGIILNKAALQLLGLVDPEDAIGQSVYETEGNNTYEIIGVVDDYHQLSLKYRIQPQVFRFNNNRGDLSVKIHANNYASFSDLQAGIASLKQLWQKIYADQPFEYQFLDARFNDQYHEEINFRKIFSFFTVLSFIIACLGLFGLSLFISLKRKKEVGVRKVFGASSIMILALFTKDYLKQLLISILIGAPLAYVIMDTWLESFSYKTTIDARSFLIPCLFLVALSVATTAYQTVRASLANPTKTLQED